MVIRMQDEVITKVANRSFENIRFPVGERFSSSPQRPDRLCGSPSCLSNGYWALFRREEQVGLEDDFPPSSSEIKNTESVPPLPMRLHGVMLNYV
jgi:hypothetical protein